MVSQTELDFHPALKKHIIAALRLLQPADEDSCFYLIPRLFPVFQFVLEKNTHLVNKYNYQDRVFRPFSAYYTGAGCSPSSASCKGSVDVILIVMKPWVATQFFKDDARHYADRQIELAHFDASFRSLNEQVSNTIRFEDKWEIIQQYFLKKLTCDYSAKQQHVARALDILHKSNGIQSIRETALMSYTSHSNLRDLFGQFVGISIKKVAEAIRFNAFVKAHCQAMHSKSLIDTALDYNYYDLSHLNKDFKRFMNLSPSEFFGPISSGFNNLRETEYL